MAIAKRKITVDTRGPIPQKSGVYGPLTRPYLEDVRVIARMIVGRIAVTEYLENGETRKLTVKDIPELTADAPKVLPQNRVVVEERNSVQELVEQKKQEALEARNEELKKAQVSVNNDDQESTKEDLVEGDVQVEKDPQPVVQKSLKLAGQAPLQTTRVLSLCQGDQTHGKYGKGGPQGNREQSHEQMGGHHALRRSLRLR